MLCQKCQRPIQADFKVCPYCGTGVEHSPKCFSCHREIDPKWIMCPYCGANIHGSMQQHNDFPQPLHGYHHDQSSGKYKKRRGFLGNLFSS